MAIELIATDPAAGNRLALSLDPALPAEEIVARVHFDDGECQKVEVTFSVAIGRKLLAELTKALEKL